MEPIVFNRQQLYDLVWNNTFLSLSEKYNISDVGLRKACVRMGIPLPQVGYWNKLKAGKEVSVKPLPPEHEGKQEVKLYLRDSSDPPDEYGISEQLKLARQIALEHSKDLRIRRQFVADPLIADLEQSFNEGKYLRDGDLMRFRDGGLRVDVSGSTMRRVLRFLNVFVGIMRKRGHELLTNASGCAVVIQGHRFEMRLTEITRRSQEKNEKGYYDYRATGNLFFHFLRLASTVSCKDGKQRIEEKIPLVVSKLELLAKQAEKERLFQEQQQSLRAEAARQREELEKRKSQELKAFRCLLMEEQRWQAARELREYIAYVRKQATRQNALTEELSSWLGWAEKKADWLDPVVKGLDEYLTDEDLETLFSPKKIPDYLSGRRRGRIHPDRRGSWPLIPWYRIR